MQEYTWILVASIGIIVFIVLNNIITNKKLRMNLKDSFGKQPTKNYYFGLESIENYHKEIQEYFDNEGAIDEITWNDLDMDKIYKRINSCHTSIGEEYLYEVLHTPEFDSEGLDEREKLIQFLKANPELRLDLQVTLSKLGSSDFNGLHRFLFDEKSKSLKHPKLYKIMASLAILPFIILPYNINLGFVSLMASFVCNMIIYYKAKKDITSNLEAIKYFSSMLCSCSQILNINDREFNELTKSLKNSFNIFKDIRDKTSNMTHKSLSGLDFIALYFRIIFLSDLRNYNTIVDRIYNNQETFHDLFKSLGEIDISIAILSFRESLSLYCLPEFINDNTIKFTEIYHPLLLDPVTNSSTLNNDSLITGSNASGKSTFIKSLAINGILAQTINTCTAKEYKTRFALVISSMALSDSITSGDSYFISEIKSLKRIIDKASSINCICFVDEILRGTNTIERIAASSSVLRFLHNLDSLCIVASHDIELTKILEDIYDNYNFSEQITDEGIYFDYKLKDGESKTRNAIKLLHYMDFDETVVKEAESLVSSFEKTKKW